MKNDPIRNIKQLVVLLHKPFHLLYVRSFDIPVMRTCHVSHHVDKMLQESETIIEVLVLGSSQQHLGQYLVAICVKYPQQIQDIFNSCGIYDVTIVIKFRIFWINCSWNPLLSIYLERNKSS